jgi:hypothetical protein
MIELEHRSRARSHEKRRCHGEHAFGGCHKLDVAATETDVEFCRRGVIMDDGIFRTTTELQNLRVIAAVAA